MKRKKHTHRVTFLQKHTIETPFPRHRQRQSVQRRARRKRQTTQKRKAPAKNFAESVYTRGELSLFRR